MSESAPGRASSSTDASDKEFSRHACPNCDRDYGAKSDLTRHMRSCCPEELEPCPTCDRRFFNMYGVRHHHSRQHGESITHDVVQCSNCGDDVEVEKVKKGNQENRYCGRKCFAEDHTNRVEKECGICGKSFKVIQFREETAEYCSRECRIERTRRITGGQRYNYKTDTYECQECGKTVERSPSMVSSEDRVFCTDGCFDDYRREGYDNYYGPNWDEQAAKARERDNHKCKICGLAQEDHYGALHVHHIKPRKEFTDESGYDYKIGNRLDNLVSLCNRCHGKYGYWGVLPLY